MVAGGPGIAVLGHRASIVGAVHALSAAGLSGAVELFAAVWVLGAVGAAVRAGWLLGPVRAGFGPVAAAVVGAFEDSGESDVLRALSQC
jgi:hypothetical protein